MIHRQLRRCPHPSSRGRCPPASDAASPQRRSAPPLLELASRSTAPAARLPPCFQPPVPATWQPGPLLPMRDEQPVCEHFASGRAHSWQATRWPRRIACADSRPRWTRAPLPMPKPRRDPVSDPPSGRHPCRPTCHVRRRLREPPREAQKILRLCSQVLLASGRLIGGMNRQSTRYKEYSASAQRAPFIVAAVEASSIRAVHSGGRLDVRFIGRGTCRPNRRTVELLADSVRSPSSTPRHAVAV